MFEEFKMILSKKRGKISSGQFGADMSVRLVNEGPITFWFDL
ncbi:MAG: D-aminoacyl-tRNA deacylase [SAR86 cluster bacterium]|nr:D-aminoacyl-tRNA deacylase [SAR86 cluster bacterium]